jgi:hypothetical protein
MKSKKALLKAKAWRLFSEYIRRKYADKEGFVRCYTCGKSLYWHGEGMQCGHGVSGRGNSVLLGLPGSDQEKICRPQCYGCNVGRGGNYEVFIPKLIREYGLEEYERLVALKQQPRKISIEEYEDIIQELERQLAIINTEGRGDAV